MKIGVWLFLLSLLGCQTSSKSTEFLGLMLGEKMPKSGKKVEPPMLAMDLQPYYEIEHPNMVFSHIGVAITENSDQLKSQGIQFRDEGIIYGAVFFNRDSNEECTKRNYDQLVGSIKKKYDVVLVKEAGQKRDQLDKWTTYYSKNVIWSVICSGKTFSVKILDLGVLAKWSTVSGKDNPFLKSISEVEEMMKRRLD